jgi:acyl-CoA hydrolase
MFGMGIDGAVDLWEAGVLATDRPAMIGAELMGTTRLFDWAHENERCEMRDFAGLFDPARAKGLGPIISINSTLEIDLWGNANSEVAGTSQVSGVGGSVDFMELAVRSGSGKSILALAATAKNGSVSKIVTRLSGVPYTIPRSAVQWVATEYGVVDLSVLSLDERAKAMVGLAAPQFRDQLWNDYLALRRQPARPFPATA